MFILRLVHRGMGLGSSEPSTNGEDRFLEAWAARQADQMELVVLDVGANEGDFAQKVLQLLGHRIGTIHCFEPHPQTAERLRRRFDGVEKIVVHEFALAAGSGIAHLNDYASSAGSGHASLLPETFVELFDSASKSFEVATMSLDDFIETNGLRRVDLLKVDVEGSEGEVFSGAARSIEAGTVATVQFELNSHAAVTGLTLRRCAELLKAERLERLLPHGRVQVFSRDGRYDARHEVFALGNYIAYPAGGS